MEGLETLENGLTVVQRVRKRVNVEREILLQLALIPCAVLPVVNEHR